MLSFETAIYSGSTSWATLDVPGFDVRIPYGSSPSFIKAKSTVRTSPSVRSSTPPASEMIETLPSGSLVKSPFGSPSLATRTYFPSGENLIMSGNAPTLTAEMKLPSVSKNTACPAACLSAFSTATATIPLWIATLLAPLPQVESSTVPILVSSDGFDISRISMTLSAPFTTKMRFETGSNAGISAALSSSIPVRYSPIGTIVNEWAPALATPSAIMAWLSAVPAQALRSTETAAVAKSEERIISPKINVSSKQRTC